MRIFSIPTSTISRSDEYAKKQYAKESTVHMFKGGRRKRDKKWVDYFSPWPFPITSWKCMENGVKTERQSSSTHTAVLMCTIHTYMFKLWHCYSSNTVMQVICCWAMCSKHMAQSSVYSTKLLFLLGFKYSAEANVGWIVLSISIMSSRGKSAQTFFDGKRQVSLALPPRNPWKPHWYSYVGLEPHCIWGNGLKRSLSIWHSPIPR